MTLMKAYTAARQSNSSASANHSESAVLALATWYTSAGRQLFVDAFEKESGLRIGTAARSDKALVEQGFPKNINEYPGKLQWDNYYIANALIGLRQLDRLLDAKAVPPGHEQIFYVNIGHLAEHLLLDLQVLADDWAGYSQGVPGAFGIVKNRIEHPMALVQSARQIIYGNVSGYSFTDNHADTAVNQFRMAIELRLRRGFGVLAKLDKSGNVVPLPLSQILDAVRPLKADIQFAVPFENIERLYSWSNTYMHSGLKWYTWSVIFALEYLTPFLLGGGYGNGGSSVHAGIQAKARVVKQVQATVGNGIDKRNFTLDATPPDECDIILLA